jgi:hypothetical protein
MPFTSQDLLLTEERKTQLTAALANLGVADPLAKVIGEAVSEVSEMTRGYVIAESRTNGWTRILSLEKAYLAAELGVPEDISNSADAVRKELAAIASGNRPNLPLTEAPEVPSTGSGKWGGDTKIGLRI